MGMDASSIAIFVTVMLALIGFAFGYGILTAKEKADRYDIEELKTYYNKIDEKLDGISTKLARMEAKLNGKSS